MDDAQQILVAGRHQADLIGEILGDAFSNDPVLNWVMYHTRDYASLFTFSAQSLFLQHDKVYLNAAATGAAMWLPPGVSSQMPTRISQIIKMLIQTLPYGFKPLKRLGQLQALFAKYHPDEPHYYLQAIGARQGNQGKGIGSALLKHTLRECDGAGALAYLESSSPNNVPLYERHGFETFHEESLPDGGPPIWFMLRQPR